MEPAVCTFFTRNACKRGTDCPFYHPREDDLPRAESATSMSFCKFDQRGSCRFGDSCKNLHKLAPKMGQGHKPVVGLARCLFFAKGHCIKGDTCKFSHSVGNELHSLGKLLCIIVESYSSWWKTQPVPTRQTAVITVDSGITGHVTRALHALTFTLMLTIPLSNVPKVLSPHPR